MHHLSSMITCGLTLMQMSEEIQNASVVVPRSMMFTVFINGSLAFGMLIMTLFSLTDVEGASNTRTGYPYMEILLHSTGSIAGAAVLTSILVVMQYFANVGLLASASRLCWSFARDRGLPGWAWLQHVSVAQAFCMTIAVSGHADMRQGRPAHLSPHPLYSHNILHIAAPLPRNPRLLYCLQRSRLPLGIWPPIILPRRHKPSSLPPLYWKHTNPPSIHLHHLVPYIRRFETQMGSLAHPGIFGLGEQHICLRLSDDCGVL